MKIHKLNSRKSNSIDWSKQEYPRYWDYSGPIAVVKSMTDIKFGSEDWTKDMPKYILGFLPTEVQDEIFEELNSASRGTPVITPWDFLSKSDSDFIKKHFGENGLKEPKYFNIKGKDGKSYFIADIITEDAWEKFISKVPKYAKYKIEEFTPGYASNSRFHKFNSRKVNSESSLDGVTYSDLISEINSSNKVDLYKFLRDSDKDTELFELWAGGSGMYDHKIKVSDILKGWRVARVYKTKYGYVAMSLPASPDPDLGSNYDEWNEAKSKLGIPSIYPKDFTGGSWENNSRFNKSNSRKCNSNPYDDLYVRLVSEFPNLTVAHEGDLDAGSEEFIEITNMTGSKVVDITLASDSNEFDPRSGYYVIGFMGRSPKQSDDLRDIINLAKDYFGEFINSRNSRLNSRQSNSEPTFYVVADPISNEDELMWTGPFESSYEAEGFIKRNDLKEFYPERNGLKGTYLEIMSRDELVDKIRGFYKSEMHPLLRLKAETYSTGGFIDRIEMDYGKNSRQSNSNPEIWDPIDVAVSKIFANSQNRTLENASLIVQALFAALSQYFPNLGTLKQLFIDAVTGNNQYLNSRFSKINSRKYNSSSKFWIVAHPDSPTDEGETIWVGPYESRDEAQQRLNESGLKSSYPETEDTYGTNISVMTTEDLLPFTERERYPGFSLDRMAWNFWDFVKLHQETYGVNSRIHKLNLRSN